MQTCVDALTFWKIERVSSIAPLFAGIITSTTRAKILTRLFLNTQQHAYLRELANEFQVSPSHMRDELLHLSSAGLLTSDREGRQINYRANPSHPLFPELQSMVQKAVGMDRILDSIVERLGHLEQAWVVDDYAEGKDTGLIDLILIGDIDRASLTDLVAKTERYIGRKIRTFVLAMDEASTFHAIFGGRPRLQLWRKEEGPSAD